MVNVLQAKILKLLKNKPNTWFIKVVSANRRGCPDILVCVDGKFFAIEIKQGKDRMSPIQLAERACIESAGGHYLVIRSKEDLERM